MDLPFSSREFFEVFGRYNTAVWPAQLFLYGIAAVIVTQVIRHERFGLSLGLLGVLWLWVGVVYHVMFFSRINPAAWVFGIAFIAQAMILLRSARARIIMQARRAAPLVAGKVLMGYALVGYPLIGYLSGHHYPETPTFAAPCPTTIFTIGVVLCTQPERAGRLLAIPVAWAGIATAAALQLSVPQDYGLTAAGLAALVFLQQRDRTRHPKLSFQSQSHFR